MCSASYFYSPFGLHIVVSVMYFSFASEATEAVTAIIEEQYLGQQGLALGLLKSL